MPRTLFAPALDGFAFANAFPLTESERNALRAALASAIDASLCWLGPLGLSAHVLGVRDRLP